MMFLYILNMNFSDGRMSLIPRDGFECRFVCISVVVGEQSISGDDRCCCCTGRYVLSSACLTAAVLSTPLLIRN